MNDLIISIAKERLLPISIDFIDYPHEHTESQLHKLSVYVVQNIMNSYILIRKWHSCLELKEDICLDLAIKHLFPEDWLFIATQSPHYHLKLTKIIQRYDEKMSQENIEKIHKIVEFLCYEIIETMFIESGFSKMFDVGPKWIQVAINSDSVLKQITKMHNIYIVDNIPSVNMIEINGIQLTNKCSKLLRVYLEKLVQNVIETRKEQSLLSKKDIDNYFFL